jgi:5-aminolevulinate synthase
MGPALVVRSAQLGAANKVHKAGYASVADIPVPKNAPGAAAAGCPHAAAAAAKGKVNPATNPNASVASASATDAAPAQHKPVAPGHFNYQEFYSQELQKKHEDKSYRYFNNINRLADKFTVAHTANVRDEVDVWCSNDYLGMSKNPVVLDTMQ